MFPFKIDFLTLLSSFPVINICLVSFFNEGGNSKPRGVTLYRTFLYFLKMFIILPLLFLFVLDLSPQPRQNFVAL